MDVVRTCRLCKSTKFDMVKHVENEGSVKQLSYKIYVCQRCGLEIKRIL